MSPFTAWILSLIVHLAPPARLAALPQFQGYEETAAQKLARYESIALDVSKVSLERAPKHPDRAAALLISLAYMEGGFARDVDLGPCYRPLPSSTRCDGGAAVSLWQLRIGSGSTSEGWTRADLQQDRQKAASTALRLAWYSMKKCAGKGADAGLRAYASGSCSRGQAESAARLGLSRRLLRELPPPAP